MENKYTFPTEQIELPSKGLGLYPDENPLSLGVIDLSYMTAKHEDILTNPNYIKNGTVVDKLLEALIVTKIDFNDLLIGDKDAIMIASRILAYGSEYEFRYFREDTNDYDKFMYDLSLLDVKIVDPTQYKGGNEFDFHLPKANVDVKFKLLTHRDERDIENELKGLKKISPNVTYDATTRLKYIITEVSGSRDRKTIRDFVDKNLLSLDSKMLRKKYNEVSVGIDMNITLTKGDYIKEGVSLPLDVTFFWPE